MKKANKTISWDELKARMDETDRKWAESQRNWEESKRRWDEMNAKMDQTLERIEIAQKKWGSLDNNIGDHAEQYFQDALRETLTFAGEKYDIMIPNLTPEGNVGGAEFDIVLINGKSVAIIETKHKIHPDFVDRLINEKVPKFREFFKVYSKHKLYLGIAGFSWHKNVLKMAKEKGIAIIRQKGKSIEVVAENLKAY